MVMSVFGGFERLLCSCSLAILVASQESSRDDFARAAQEALRSRSDMPWYDSSRDALQPIFVTPSQDDVRRHSTWAVNESPDESSPVSGSASFVSQLMQFVAWTLLVGVLATVAWWLVQAWRRRKSVSRDDPAPVGAAEGATRLDELPHAPPRDERDLLAAARRSYAAGDYGQAIVFVFTYQLLQLDTHHAIRLAKGKTNRQYLWELRGQPRLQDLLRDAILAFEDVYFGRHDLPRARYEHCWQNLDEFHRQLESLP
jgi:hypothetical protein